MAGHDLGRIMFIGVFTALTIMRAHFKRRYRVPAVASVRASEGALFSTAKLAISVLLAGETIRYVLSPTFFPVAALVPLPLWLRLAGGLLCCGWLILLYRTHLALGEAFRTVGEPAADAGLVTDGPYAHLRHPMYLAYLGLFVSSFLVTGAPILSALGFLIILLLVLVRAPREEALLMRRFGRAYASYREETPPLLPRLRRDRTASPRRIDQSG